MLSMLYYGLPLGRFGSGMLQCPVGVSVEEGLRLGMLWSDDDSEHEY